MRRLKPLTSPLEPNLQDLPPEQHANNLPHLLKVDAQPIPFDPSSIPTPIPTDFNSTEEEHNARDAALNNITQTALYAAWRTPHLTLNTALRLVSKSIDFMKHSRKLYGLPYDSASGEGSVRRHRVIPID